MVHFNHLGAIKFSEKIADIFATQYNFDKKENYEYMYNDAEYYLYKEKLDEANDIYEGDFQLSEDILIKGVKLKRQEIMSLSFLSY
jgi:hypothetical protein